VSDLPPSSSRTHTRSRAAVCASARGAVARVAVSPPHSAPRVVAAVLLSQGKTSLMNRYVSAKFTNHYKVRDCGVPVDRGAACACVLVAVCCFFGRSRVAAPRAPCPAGTCCSYSACVGALVGPRARLGVPRCCRASAAVSFNVGGACRGAVPPRQRSRCSDRCYACVFACDGSGACGPSIVCCRQHGVAGGDCELPPCDSTAAWVCAACHLASIFASDNAAQWRCSRWCKPAVGSRCSRRCLHRTCVPVDPPRSHAARACHAHVTLTAAAALLCRRRSARTSCRRRLS
jgi:hypothetical protein